MLQPLFILVGMTDAVAAEQDGNPPDACKADDRIDDARYDGAHAAENAGDEVELEDADQPPVQRTDDDENKRECIHVFSLSFVVMQIACAGKRQVMQRIARWRRSEKIKFLIAIKWKNIFFKNHKKEHAATGQRIRKQNRVP